MKIAAVFVAYKPDVGALVRNVTAVIDSVEYVLIWRNSVEDYSALASLSDKIVLLGNGENQYIAGPLNQALKWSASHGCDFLLTMDQDSTWTDFASFKKNVEFDVDNNIAIYAPSINRNSDYREVGGGKIPDYQCVDFVITSGSLINVSIAQLIGGFNVNYKIYWVDSEFCYKVKNNGYRIKQFSGFSLFHKLGNPSKTLFGFTTSNYSPQMYYFIFRNMIWEHREYGPNAVSYKCLIYTFMYNIRGIILGERAKCRKLYKIFQATFHGLFYSYR